MIKYFFSISVLISFYFCTENGKYNLEMDSYMYLETNPDFKTSITEFSKKRIFFGHQSVGNNIITGLNEINGYFQDTYINIIDSINSDTLTNGFIYHAWVGKNYEPELKCNSFENQIVENLKDKIDIALLKFCYVDINRNTDVLELFNFYKYTISKLKDSYPNIQFIHITIPLMARSGNWKTLVKRLINYEGAADLDNIKRNEFNSLMREFYKNESIFDLANYESTYSDGTKETFTYNDNTYNSLAPIYTYDGGHLNKQGRIYIASKFIETITNLSKE